MNHFILLAALFSATSAANILGVFPFPSESHHVLGSILMGNLAKRGHNITYITPFKMKTSVPNVTTLVIDELVKFKEEKLQEHLREGSSFGDYMGRLKALNGFQSIYMKSPTMQWFLKSDTKFDLMIHFMGTDVSLGLAHHFDVPIIIFSAVGGVSLIGDRFGNPSPVAYVPSIFLPYSDDMNFSERLKNTIAELLLKAVIPVVRYFVNEAVQEHFPGAPHLSEIENRAQMSLVNSHVSTETPRPYVPAMVQIGGYHMHEPEPLPNELKKILDEAPHGVIYVSFGTNIQISEIPDDKLKIIMKSLGQLPLNVLLKSDKPLPYRSENVEVRPWFPQRGILAHQNLKAFISHGGYGGATETLFYGVPMICIPFMADQPQNCVSAEQDGYGIHLPLDQVTSETFDISLEKVISDKSFITKAKLKSELYRDQEMNPMDKAAYWVNHVIKHKGAKHLRVKALDLAWYQYYLLDVIAMIVIVFTVISAMSLYILRCCFNRLCRRHQKIKTS